VFSGSRHELVAIHPTAFDLLEVCREYQISIRKQRYLRLSSPSLLPAGETVACCRNSSDLDGIPVSVSPQGCWGHRFQVPPERQWCTWLPRYQTARTNAEPCTAGPSCTSLGDEAMP